MSDARTWFEPKPHVSNHHYPTLKLHHGSQTLKSFNPQIYTTNLYKFSVCFIQEVMRVTRIHRLFRIWVFWLHRSYSLRVCVIPNEGWARPCAPLLHLVWQRQRSYGLFSRDASHVWVENCSRPKFKKISGGVDFVLISHLVHIFIPKFIPTPTPPGNSTNLWPLGWGK